MHLFNPRKTKTDALFLQYGDLIYRLALARLSNDADAQDVVQDVFMSYLTNKPEFKDSNHEKAWFLRTTVNRCHDLSRRQKTRAHLPIENAYGLADKSETVLNDLLELISQLPPIYKDVVILHSLEGFSLGETAGILEISLSAAKMRLSRAKEILKTLRKEEDDV